MDARKGLLVVGVDGSPPSQRALEWAIEEAALRGAAVQAVTSYLPEPNDPVEPQPGWMAHARQQAEEAQRSAVEQAVKAHPGVEVAAEIVHATPADALILASRSADLLVLGSRGLGSVRGLLLGSVSQQVARHAACPVVVLPATESERPGTAEDLARMPGQRA